MRQVIRSPVIVAVFCLHGFSTHALAIEPPAWAYPFNPPDYEPAPEGGVPRRVPDSTVSCPLSQTRNLFFAPDWHPADHPQMPAIVARGRMPDVIACGFAVVNQRCICE